MDRNTNYHVNKIKIYLQIITNHGGANRDRTDDLLNAIQTLSQLSYGPKTERLHWAYFIKPRKRILPKKAISA